MWETLVKAIKPLSDNKIAKFQGSVGSKHILSAWLYNNNPFTTQGHNQLEGANQ